tara:strand:- start:611 stop:712 length:102 start_codon:yes stop_codon:yes gene_type:complete
MGIIGMITIFGIGVVVGIYTSSQIEKHIDKNSK